MKRALPGLCLLVCTAIAALIGRALCPQSAAAKSSSTENGALGITRPTPDGFSASRVPFAQISQPKSEPGDARLTLPPNLRASIQAQLARWHAAQTDDEAGRDEVQQTLLALLTDGNAEAIARFLPAEDRATPFALAALERWLQRDPLTATNWLADQSAASEPQTLLAAHALLADPAASAATWDRLPDGAWKQTLLATAAREIADTDPARAISLAQRIEPGDGRTDTLQTIGYTWISRDPPAAARWILSLDDSTLRDPLLAVAAKSIALTDPELAISWWQAIKSEKAAGETAISLADLWAARSPGDAATWVARFPAASVRDDAIDAVARQWLDVDSPAAETWIASLPDRDRVLARIYPVAVVDADTD
jgi:hypothetical protein